jgi:ribosomal protein S18 acetylase RimI-like enzyme
MTGRTEVATFADVAAIRAVLAAAYHDDPMTEWLFPDEPTRPHACAAWYGLFVEQYVAIGRANLLRDDGEVVALALWRRPGDAPLSPTGVPSISGLMSALMGVKRGADLAEALHAVGQVQETQPHVYLNFLAVAPDRQRAGFGRRVLGPVLTAARAEGLGVRLETTNPANYAFYDTLGFREVGRLQLAAGGPLLRALSLDR